MEHSPLETDLSEPVINRCSISASRPSGGLCQHRPGPEVSVWVPEARRSVPCPYPDAPFNNTNACYPPSNWRRRRLFLALRLQWGDSGCSEDGEAGSRSGQRLGVGERVLGSSPGVALNLLVNGMHLNIWWKRGYITEKKKEIRYTISCLQLDFGWRHSTNETLLENCVSYSFTFISCQATWFGHSL